MTEDLKKRQLFADLGKATRRGIRKCPQCGTINGTRGMSCKNSLCDMVFKESLDKPRRVNLDACKIITEERLPSEMQNAHSEYVDISPYQNKVDSDFKTDFGGQDEPAEQPGMIQKLIKFFTN